VVEFFVSVGVADVAVGFGTDGVVASTVSGDCGEFPIGTGVFQEGSDVVAGGEGRGLDASQVAEGRINRGEIDGSFGAGAGLGHSWGNPDEGDSCGFFPEGELPPVFFFAE